ncbi:MAG TPA: hypothetical protein VJ227_02495 [Patescibacteria group bacterium]|nr:hypothetical protein [Patescibacteria group bacterium]
MIRNGKKALHLIFTLALFAAGLAIASFASAVEDPCVSKSGPDKVDCYDKLVTQYNQQAKTLANQIAQYDAQIKLTTYKIADTEAKIQLLGGRIDQLELSLNELTQAFSSRAVETYKVTKFENNFFFILSADDINEAVSRLHYLKKIQEEDRNLLNKLQEAQTTYEDQKADQETLQEELESQKALLDRQKKDKANLLAITKNNETTFAKLRDEAAAELAVVSGLGKETYLRDVGTNDTIGSIITSASGCSSGQHLHFEVHQGSSAVDPNNFLSGTGFSYSYDSSQYGYYGTINPHGSWPWPINSPISINQGYGATGFARDFYSNKFHQGIDMDSDSSTQVKAVHGGKLYAGAYTCKGYYPGTLYYAKVDHGDGTTVWYLHILPR